MSPSAPQSPPRGRRARRSRLAWSLWAGVGLLLPAAGAQAQLYLPQRALIGVRSDFSSGSESVEAIAAKAERLGFAALLFADHHRLSLAWGAPPFRHLLKKEQEFPSISVKGVRPYLRSVIAADERHRRTVVMSGITTTPFYYWTGSPFQETLTARQWYTRLLIFGLDNRPETLRGLPEVNGPFSLRYSRVLLPGTVLFVVAALIGLILFFACRGWRAAGFLVFVAGAAFSLNYHPFSSTPFDAYHGDQGAAPYQLAVDYVRQRGGIALWSGEGWNPRGERVGIARLQSRPRPELLVETRGYAGLDAFSGGAPEPTAPGGPWDRTLTEYVEGKRTLPVWIYGGAAGREISPEGTESFSTKVQTILYLRERSQAAVLDALRQGKMVAVREGNGFRLQLDHFSVKPAGIVANALPGQTLRSAGPVEMRFRISSTDGENRPLTVRIIRDGSVAATLQGTAPYEHTFSENHAPPGKTGYYRLEASEPSGARLLTNPVFVRFEPAPAGRTP